MAKQTETGAKAEAGSQGVQSSPEPQARRRGRPPGSKNKRSLASTSNGHGQSRGHTVLPKPEELPVAYLVSVLKYAESIGFSVVSQA
jgi:hypothetical protein